MSIREALAHGRWLKPGDEQFTEGKGTGLCVSDSAVLAVLSQLSKDRK